MNRQLQYPNLIYNFYQFNLKCLLQKVIHIIRYQKTLHIIEFN
jgi:hypothetical protein